MYICDFNISFSESNAVRCDDIELMHERLGHLNEKSLLFLKKSGRISFGGKFILILIYVDDILIASNNVNDLVNTKSKLDNKFDMVDLKEVKQFLGINISYSGNVMTLSQEKYIEKLARKFDKASFDVYTPIEKGLKLESNKNGALNVKLPYRQLIGSLLYVSMATRPDICYSVNYFSQFQSSYTDEHYKYLLRVLSDLKTTKSLKLTYV